MEKVQQIHSFLLLAYVILLDNFYWLMRVDDAAGNFSTVLHSVKRNYTLNYKKTHGIGTALRLWQGRFWDHVIRDEHDLQRHFDYIRWNPVRHGYVTGPENWTQSTFLHWAERGYYAPEWGTVEIPRALTGWSLSSHDGRCRWIRSAPAPTGYARLARCGGLKIR